MDWEESVNNCTHFIGMQQDLLELNVLQRIFLHFNLNFIKIISLSSIDIKSVSQVMAWCKTGAKPLLELMMTKFTDAKKAPFSPAFDLMIRHFFPIFSCASQSAAVWITVLIGMVGAVHYNGCDLSAEYTCHFIMVTEHVLLAPHQE